MCTLVWISIIKRLHFRCLSSVSNLLVRIARVIVEEQRSMLFRLLLATAVVIKSAIVHPDTPNYLSRKLRDLRMSLTERVGEVSGQKETCIFVTVKRDLLAKLCSSFSLRIHSGHSLAKSCKVFSPT